MTPNPLLKKLGFPNDARVVILHADDIGMCHASVSAFADLVDFGLISSGATMVPCPWFPAAAALCRANPHIDMGVHLTLNSEWETYRWGPVSTRDRASGLIDEEGYFYRRQPPVQEYADPATVAVEIAAQFQRAQQAGIDITHVDTHMGTVAHARFIDAYVKLAREHRVPALLLRLDQAGYRALGMDELTAAACVDLATRLEGEGLPLLDAMRDLPLDESEDRVAVAQRVLGSVPAGITHLAIHPSQDTPELRAITPDWPSRVADYRAFTDEGLRRWIKDSGLHIIGYRAIKATMGPLVE
jgi:predicted glycoside hydrolase/deacetylase ChbG (UPF0249 family)